MSGSLVIPQATIYLSESSPLCVVRDITLERPNGQWGTITILGKPVEVCYTYEGDGFFILADNHPVDIEAFFRGDTTKEDREKHPRHIEKNIYWGGCHFCDCEHEAHEMEMLTRKVTHVVFKEPIEDAIGDHASVVGLVEGAETQEDLIWVIERFTGTLEQAKPIVAKNPLAKDAIWVDEDEFQKLVEALPAGRQGKSYVDFGDPRFDRWAM